MSIEPRVMYIRLSSAPMRLTETTSFAELLAMSRSATETRVASAAKPSLTFSTLLSTRRKTQTARLATDVPRTPMMTAAIDASRETRIRSGLLAQEGAC